MNDQSLQVVCVNTGPCVMYSSNNKYEMPRETNYGRHLMWTTVGPVLSYSCLVIHVSLIDDKEMKTDPPIHAECMRSGLAITSMLHPSHERAVRSLLMRSANPGNRVLPPLKTMFWNNKFLMSRSQRMMLSNLMKRLKNGLGSIWTRCYRHDVIAHRGDDMISRLLRPLYVDSILHVDPIDSPPHLLVPPSTT